MKHYYFCSFIVGCLGGYACVDIAGPIGGICLSLILGCWSIKSAYDMNKGGKEKA